MEAFNYYLCSVCFSQNISEISSTQKAAMLLEQNSTHVEGQVESEKIQESPLKQ